MKTWALALVLSFILHAAVIVGGVVYIGDAHDDAVNIAHAETVQFEHRLWDLLCNSDPPPIPIQREPFCSRLFPERGAP